VLAAVLESRGMVLVMVWLAGFGLAAWGASRLFARFVVAPAASTSAPRRCSPAPPCTSSRRGQCRQPGPDRDPQCPAAPAAQLQQDVAQQVALASRGIEAERSRLSALMAELTQSVVVCNLDGAILLYNSRARAQFRAWSSTPATAGGAELIGLGRSIYASSTGR
jgi:DNA polymerase-3 subunit epsilon